MNHNYKVCRRCVMDTSAPEIVFDSNGVCNFCKFHLKKMDKIHSIQEDSNQALNNLIVKIKADSQGDYDCIVGLSGGVDSSFVAYQAVKLGLRPLAVHFDNGWNSELAVKNIENIVKTLNLDLCTFVIDWEEFKDIQRSFFKANVIDIELVTDHAIFAAMFKIAGKNKIRYILSGTNAATESIMPKSWQHFKFDLLNLKSIHKRFGTLPIQNYPTIGICELAWNHYCRGAKSISLLDFINYKKHKAMEILKNELGWRDYGGKHYESVFTKFYQAHILPKKFGVDKRRIHFSDLIMNGEISRDDALSDLALQSYCPLELEHDRDYVCKKLGFSEEEFSAYMNAPRISHYDYLSYAKLVQPLVAVHKYLKN